MGKIITKLGLARYDSDRQLIEKRTQPSRSWIKHFFDVTFPLFAQQQLTNIPDVGANNRTMGTLSGSPKPNLMVGSPGGSVQQILAAKWNGYSINYYTPLSGQNNGIIVGSNNTAVTTGDNALNTRINHGVAAGELLYGGTEIFGLTFANPNGSFTIRRFFENVSGGDVTVQECGIYCPGWNAAEYTYQFCIARDITGAIVVATTEILEVTYTVQITV